MASASECPLPSTAGLGTLLEATQTSMGTFTCVQAHGPTHTPTWGAVGFDALCAGRQRLAADNGRGLDPAAACGTETFLWALWLSASPWLLGVFKWLPAAPRQVHTEGPAPTTATHPSSRRGHGPPRPASPCERSRSPSTLIANSFHCLKNRVGDT